MDFKDICLIITGVITIASVIVKLTPTKKDDQALGVITKILRVLSLYKKDSNQ